MDYQFKTLTCRLENKIMLITINRPSVLNALNSEVFADLKNIFIQLKNDNEAQVIVLTGAGNKAFAAGSDVSEMAQCTLVQGREFALLVNEAQQAIANLPKPTIAAINGFAFGGGLEVAMCCDIRLASEKAKLGQPEINLGIIPGGGGTQRLSRLVGIGIAKEMIFTGKAITASRAYEIGLVNYVVPEGELIDKAMEMAGEIINKSPVSLSFAKAALNVGADLDLENALKVEIELFAECFATEDGKEGLNAFVNKRKPIFSGK